MKTLALSLSALTICVAPLALAQESQTEGKPSAAPVAPVPVVPGGASSGYNQLMNLMSQSAAKQARVASAGEAGYPMFQFFGPDMRSAFWADPETAGRILILQGELMGKMGETLIRQGQELLGEEVEPLEGQTEQK